MAKPLKRLPKLPATLFSVLGGIPVSLKGDLLSSKEALGMFHGDSRTVELQSGMSHEAAWQTLCHEMAHAALWDAGAHNALNKDQEEAVVDAIGTYLVAAIKAGHITIRG